MIIISFLEWNMILVVPTVTEYNINNLLSVFSFSWQELHF